MYNLFIRFLSVFILNKHKRKKFRQKYLKLTNLQLLQKEINENRAIIIHHIDKRFNQYINSFHLPSDIICNDINLQNIQMANNILLQEFKRICDENNIEYWLDWGTLLGAVRHKGFIPWDDDIDVSMTRNNIEKLFNAVEKEQDFILTEWLHLAHPTDKCRVKKFCFNNSNVKCYIDVFAYDYCNTLNKENFYNELLENKKLMQKDLTALKMPQYSHCACNNKSDLKLINNAFGKYISLYAGQKSGNCLVYGIESPCNVAKKILDTKTIFPLSKVMFNGIEYSAPNDVDEFLSVCYGNYMKIPMDVGAPKHIQFKRNEIKEILSMLKNYKEGKND